MLLPCGVSGWPQAPSKPIATEQDGNEVSLEVKSFFPGSATISFIVTPIVVKDQSETTKEKVHKKVVNYLAGSSIDIIIPNLTTGSEYRFRVKIENEFGSSSSVTSDSILIKGQKKSFYYFI